MMMKKVVGYLPYVLLVLFIGTITLFALLHRNPSFNIAIPGAKSLNAFVYEGRELGTLPNDQVVEVNTDYSIETVLPEDFAQRQVLLFRTSLQNMDVYLDGDLVYSIDYEDYENYASMWHYVELSGDNQGKTLRVTYSSPFEAMSGVLNEVHYGDQASLAKTLLVAYGYRLLIGLFTVLVGLVIMFVSLFLYRKQNTAYIYLGLFAIVLGAWMVSESRLLQLFTGNVFVVGSLSYISLAVIGIPLFAYMIFHVDKAYHKYFYSLIGYFSLLSIFVVFLEFSDLMGFFESVVITQVSLVIAIVITIVTLLLEKFKNQSHSVDEVFMYLVVFSIFGFFELVNFFLSNFEYTSYFMVIGVAIVIVMMTYNYIKFVIGRYKLSYEHEFYEYLAYHDPITGALNRLAYEQDFDQLFQVEEQLVKLRLLYFDLDDLKHINDTYGHLEGDYVIKKGYDIIEETFGFFGTVYRIGGDEFACLAVDMTDKDYQEARKVFIHLVKEADLEKDYHFGLSIGGSMYKEGDKKPEDIVTRADQEMYDYKDQTKKERKKGS
jgi:diguanylate cyclase (GGDEF)-like protein